MTRCGATGVLKSQTGRCSMTILTKPGLGDGDDDDLVLSQFVCVGAGGQESPLES